MITPTPATKLHPQPQLKPKTRHRVMRTQGQWKALLEEFNNGGLTRAAFCKKHRIATSSLYRWQQIFGDDGEPTDFIDVTEPLSNPPSPPPVRERDNSWQVELELSTGIVLRLRTT